MSLDFPGLHRDMPLREYLALEALSMGDLRNVWISRARMDWRRQQEDAPSEDMQFGSALHLAILQPELFGDNVGFGPDELRSGEARAKQAELQTQFPIVLRSKHKVTLLQIAAIAENHPFWLQLLDLEETAPADVVREASMLWEVDGVACKSRPDVLFAIGEQLHIIDLKSVASIDRDFFTRSLAAGAYHLTAGWRALGLERCGRHLQSYTFFVVERENALEARAYALGHQDIERAKRCA